MPERIFLLIGFNTKFTTLHDMNLQLNIFLTGTFEVEVEITPEMSTSGMIVFYYIRPDGEVVSDGIRISVEECSHNNVSIIVILEPTSYSLSYTMSTFVDISMFHRLT